MKRRIRYIIIVIVFLNCFIYYGYRANAVVDAFKYESNGKRDPLVPLIGKETSNRSGLEGIVSIQDVNLEGIAIGALGKQIAILNGQMVKENDKFGNLHIKKILRKSIRLSIEGKDYTLELQEEGKIANY